MLDLTRSAPKSANLAPHHPTEHCTPVVSKMTVAVKVKCFNGKCYDLAVEPESETVAQFQQKISDASGITPERQTILFKGKVLDEASKVADYAFAEGVTVSVVRRVGKATPKPESPAPTPATTAPTATATPPANETQSTPAGDTKPNDTPPAQPTLEDMMRNLNMGANSGMPGMMPGMENLAAMFNGTAGGLGGAGAGAGAGAVGPGAGAGGPGAAQNMENFYRQLPQMMNGLFGPMLQEYLADPEKQELSRESILNNPLLKQLCDTDPEFSKVVNDPEKWKASMTAARKMFSSIGDAGAGPGVGGTTPASEGSTEAKATAATAAAAAAPPGVNIAKLSESYGHALGQSLVNSGLGLDPDLVVKGLGLAVAGKPFPMPLPEYERSMAQLQSIAQEYLTKTNLEHANNMFKELEKDGTAIVLEEGRIAYEKGDAVVDTSKSTVKENANVLVIVTARLLDGRHFFTCPAADDTGESVHPLTLSLTTAPPALAKGIVGMHEGETRLLYVHPEACEGMVGMFGDLLPPNALLIFDLQLLDAAAEEEEADQLAS